MRYAWLPLLLCRHCYTLRLIFRYADAAAMLRAADTPPAFFFFIFAAAAAAATDADAAGAA